jgi:hypothetical protein
LVVIVLIIASAITGLVFGRFFRAYALIPAALLLFVPTAYLGHEQGLSTGVRAFVLSVVAMQVCYFASLMAHLVIENLSVVEKVSSKAAPSPPELSSHW